MNRRFLHPRFILLVLSMLALTACPDNKVENTPDPLAETKDLAFEAPTIPLSYSGTVGATIKVYTPKWSTLSSGKLLPSWRKSTFWK